MHRQLITRDPADAVEVFRCLLYMSVLPPELDLARSQVAPAAPPDASPPHPRAWAGPTPPPASAAATAATAIAVAHLPGPHRAAYGLLNQLCCFLSDPDGAAAEAACVFDALVPPQGEPVGTSPQQEPQEGPRAACGATQQRVLCAAKLLATRGARQGLPLLSFLAVQGLPHERGGCVLGTRAGIKGGVAPPPAPGLLPPGTQALCGGMDSERLVWALLKIRIMLSNQLARKTRQQQQQQQQEEHGQQAATPRLVAWEPELLTLAAFTLHQDFNLLKGYETVFQPAVDVHLANMLLAGDTPVTEEVRRTRRWVQWQLWGAAALSRWRWRRFGADLVVYQPTRACVRNPSCARDASAWPMHPFSPPLTLCYLGPSVARRPCARRATTRPQAPPRWWRWICTRKGRGPTSATRPGPP